MQTLLLNECFFDQIEGGKKTSTIRRIRSNRPLPVKGSYLQFVDSQHRERRATVKVSAVRHLRMYEITEREIKSEGFDSLDRLQDCLKTFYKGLQDDEVLALIEFQHVPVEGEIKVTYEDINKESFDKARNEIEWDLGWASWTDNFPAIWTSLNIDRNVLDQKVGVRVIASDPDTRTIEVSIPANNIDWQYNGVAALLSLVAGDVLGSSGVGDKARVKAVNIPESVRCQFCGPTLGIDGIRNLCQVYERPIVAFSVKPRLGLSSEQFSKVCTEVALGGVDIVEDDERLSNQSFSRLLERADTTVNALARAGVKTLYSANITGRADKIVGVAEKLIDIGVKLLKIDVLPVGFAGLQTVAEWAQIKEHLAGITVYPAMNRMYERAVKRQFILDLCRLCGADILYAGVPPISEANKVPEDRRYQDQVRHNGAAEHHLLLKVNQPQKKVLPTVSTNITPMNIGAYSQLLGNNVGFFIGAGIAAYTGSLQEGASLLMKAVKNKDYSFTEKELQKCRDSGFGDLIRYSELDNQVRNAFNSVRNL